MLAPETDMSRCPPESNGRPTDFNPPASCLPSVLYVDATANFIYLDSKSFVETMTSYDYGDAEEASSLDAIRKFIYYSESSYSTKLDVQWRLVQQSGPLCSI